MLVMLCTSSYVQDNLQTLLLCLVVYQSLFTNSMTAVYIVKRYVNINISGQIQHLLVGVFS